jgi:hypothetical protein
MTRLFLTIIVLFSIISCSSGNDGSASKQPPPGDTNGGSASKQPPPGEEDDLPIIPSPPPQPTVIADIFEDDFESKSKTFSLWETEVARGNYSVQIVDDYQRRGNHAVKFTLGPKDIVNNGNRSELRYQDYDPNISEVYYSWSVMLDSNYIDTGKWQILGQWHDQPDESIGETWDTYPPNNPPISLHYLNGYMYAIVSEPQGKYENASKRSKKKRVELGKWIDIVFHIYWSLEEDGFVTVWIDGENVTPYNGKDYKIYAPTIFNRAGNYLKIGLYRASGATVTNTVYFDNVKIGMHTY